ncbi:MAG TPA: hypothetical protein VFK88_05305 [Gallionella sp.]|nr:hypothetical protein [Gallionella sp.]
MTTSGINTFSLSRDEIITSAALEVGDIALGDTLDDGPLSQYALRLNSLVKSLMADGAKLWAMQLATLFLVPGQARYSLGTAGDHCTASYVRTTLSASAAASATTVSLTDTTGMSAGDNIGILLDSGALFWTTISGAPGAPTTLAVALSGAASAGATVFTYTTKISRPQRIDPDSAFWRSSALQDTPVAMISRSEYAQLANKSVRGKLVQAFYDPQLVSGQLSVWPTPISAADVLCFWYERLLEDFTTGSDTPDFAIEWGEALILGLAHLMAPSAGLSLAERQDLERRAELALDKAMGYDRENVGVFFQPDMR